MLRNIHYVNASLVNIDAFFSVFVDAYKTGRLSEDFAYLFTIEFPKGYNPDGSYRMIIKAA